MVHFSPKRVRTASVIFTDIYDVHLVVATNGVNQPKGTSNISTILCFQLFKVSLDTYPCMLNPKAVHTGKVALMEVFHCALHISSVCLHCAWHYCNPSPKVRFHICEICLN